MDIEEIFKECLAKKNEDSTNFIKAEGVVTIVIFNQNRLEEYKTTIETMLSELSNFSIKIENNQWDKQLEQLLQLGIGLNIIKTPIYRKEKVEILPNGTIFYSVAS